MSYETPYILSDLPLNPGEGDDRKAHFHFNEYAVTLARLIAAKSTATPITIGVYGPWGSGKTTLLLRTKALLDGEKVKGEDGQPLRWNEGDNFRTVKTVWFNAWKYHEEDSLLAALIRAILQAMAKDGLFAKVKSDWGKKDYDLFKTLISAFKVKFGLPGVAELEFHLDPEKNPPEFTKHLAFFDAFEETLERLIKTWAGKDGVLAVFIDDLDRCPPDRVVQVLEAIKLFLDRTGAAFVLAADEDAVLQAVMQHYRTMLPDTETDQTAAAQRLRQWAREYMEKIVQVRFPIPAIQGWAMREGYFQDLAGEIWNDGREIPPELQQVIVAAAESNPRKVKTFLNGINLAWAALQNADRVGQSNEDLWLSFVGVYAVLRAAPNAFYKQVQALTEESPSFSSNALRRLWEDAQRWARGADDREDGGQTIFDRYNSARGFKRALAILADIHPGVEKILEVLSVVLYFMTPVAETSEGKFFVDIVSFDVKGLRLPLVRVPKGPFLMGSTNDDFMADSDEMPAKDVNIAYDYWIARFPITWRQYQQFDNDAVIIPPDKEEHPVVSISWKDALKFVDWLNDNYAEELRKIVGDGYCFALPSELEWEKAARGPYGNRWPWGNEWQDGLANTREAEIGDTTPVGIYSPDGDSPYGVADMVGNVWEWTRSVYKKYPYNSEDGRESFTRGGERVLRGGSFKDSKLRARAAAREWQLPYVSSVRIGFRVVVLPKKYLHDGKCSKEALRSDSDD